MRALVCHRLSDDLSGLAMTQVPDPARAPGEVLIEVRAAALNFPDLLMTRGGYQHKPELPFTPGMEGAGRVLQADADSLFASGDAVRFSGYSGALAQRASVPASRVRRVPDGVDDAQAAAFEVGAITAYVSLVRLARLARGETLLVHGSAGGMGLAAVQLGLHLGATVIATGTSAEKLDTVKAQGADHVLRLHERWRDEVKSLTGGRGADVVYDPVGGDVFDESTHCIAFGGRLLVVGFTSGRAAKVATNLVLIKGFSVIGVRAGEFGRRFPMLGAQNLDAIDRLFADGVFRPYIGARFPLERAVDAMRALASRAVVGKVVVEMPVS